MTLLSRGLARSRDKLKLLYFHYHSIHGHQAWRDGDLPWGAPYHKVIKRFDHVVLQGYVTNENHYIFPTRVSMATKRGRMITYLDGLLPIKSLDSLITWSCEITWETKSIILNTTVLMVTKLGRMVTYLQGLLTL